MRWQARSPHWVTASHCPHGVLPGRLSLRRGAVLPAPKGAQLGTLTQRPARAAPSTSSGAGSKGPPSAPCERGALPRKRALRAPRSRVLPQVENAVRARVGLLATVGLCPTSRIVLADDRARPAPSLSCPQPTSEGPWMGEPLEKHDGRGVGRTRSAEAASSCK